MTDHAFERFIAVSAEADAFRLPAQAGGRRLASFISAPGHGCNAKALHSGLKWFRAGIAWLFILGWLGYHPVLAQDKTGTTVGQFLLIEPSARVAGMGNAGVALYDEIVSAYFNPGAIGYQSGYGAQFTHSEWLADISFDYVAAAIQLKDAGNLFLSVTSLNSGEMDVRTVEQPLGTGARFSVSNIALGLGFGRKITDRFAAGIQVNYIQETIWNSSFSTFAINIGTVYHLANGVRIGASLSNFGLQANYSGRDLRFQYDNDPNRHGDNSTLPGQVVTGNFSLPVLFRVGIAWPVRLTENNQLQIAMTAFHPNDNTESVSFGAEWMLWKTVALRGGYQNLFLNDSEVGLTLGAGLYQEIGGLKLRFDYAWADHGRLEQTQRFTLGVAF